MKSFDDDSSVDKSLVYFIEGEDRPHCSVHGSMLLMNGIYRCYGTYKGRWDGFTPKGQAPTKFIERTCNAGVKI